MSHVVFLVHGYLGRPRGMQNLADNLRASSDDLVVHIVQCNDLFASTDGIAAGGNRVAKEIREVVSKNPDVKRISLVGGSLGGLYCRWAISKLVDEDNKIAGLVPFAFITLATPHIGVFHSLSMVKQLAVYAAWYTNLDRTGGEILGLDNFDTLYDMIGPLFIRALRVFKHRFLFANLINDDRVDYVSAAILGFPLEKLQRADDVRQEIVGNYDILNHPEFMADIEKGYDAENLSDRQKHMMRALRVLQYTNVDVRFEGVVTAPILAHSYIAGTLAHLGFPGSECVRRVINIVTQEE